MATTQPAPLRSESPSAAETATPGTSATRAIASRVLVSALAVLLFLTVVPGRGADASSSRQAPGELLVAFAPGTSPRMVAQLSAGIGASVIESLEELGVLRMRIPDRTMALAEQLFRGLPMVRFVEPNALVAPQVVSNDTNYSRAWHLPKIDVPGAWDQTRADGVLIAVCDSGVASDHPDLSPVLRGDLGWNAADGSNDWSPVLGHGTQVAGAAAAATNNGTGVAGVAWGAGIIPVRITNRSDGVASVADAAKCIRYAADRGARVINLSYRMADSATIDSAAAYAASKGAVTTVAAGNDGTNPGWTHYPSFLAVSSTTDSDTLAASSNFGSFIDVAAPGTSIWTTNSGGSYAAVSGTSFAAPVAAGVLALMFGANPELTAADAKSILLSSADDIGQAGSDPQFGAGRVNARRAVEQARGGSSGGVAPAPAPAPDGQEAPDNQSVSQALVTDTFSASIGRSDGATSFVFTVRNPGRVDVQLSWTGLAGVDVAVYNATGRVASGQLTALWLKEVSFDAAAGDHQVIVTTKIGQANVNLTVTYP